MDGVVGRPRLAQPSKRCLPTKGQSGKGPHNEMAKKSVRRLFVDDAHIEKEFLVERKCHQPRNYIGNPLMVGDRFHDARSGVRYEEDEVPREGGVEKLSHSLTPTSVVRDEEAGIFRMYYQTRSEHLFDDMGYGGGTPVVAYAESHNGIHWHLPPLNRVLLKNKQENNILFYPPGSLATVVIDRQDRDASRRYKMLFYPPSISFSSDGIGWTEPQKIEIPTHIGQGDGLTCLAGWDARIGKYVAYFRPQVARPEQLKDVEGKTIRLIGRSESADLKDWSELKAVLVPDENDPPGTEFQNIGAFFYEGMYLGLLCFHEGFEEERPMRFPQRAPNVPVHAPMLGRCYVELVSSWDGIHWNRLEDRSPFIQNEPGSLGSGVIWPANAPVVLDTELWFYFGMGFHSHGFQLVKMPGLAKLRRDGFVSLAAGDKEGWIVTKRFTCPGGRLFVNADACGGQLSVSVVDADDYHFPYYAKVRCATLDQDSLANAVTWVERSDLTSLEGKEIRLKFYLRNADLYSFWFK